MLQGCITDSLNVRHPGHQKRLSVPRLLITSEQASGYEKRALAFWRSKNIRIDTSTLDASKLDDAKRLLSLAQSMGPLAGIYHVTPATAVRAVHLAGRVGNCP